MKAMPCAAAALIAFCGAANAQQYSGSGVMTPSTAVSPQGPLTFTPAKATNPIDYGARCDGSTDDTAALAAWAASATPGSRLVVPGVCVFSSPIAFPRVSNVTIEGAAHPSTLLYVGAPAAANVITIGATTGGCSVTGWSVHRLRLMSNTAMSGGDALRFNDVCESDVTDLDVGGDLGGNQNWWNAVHFNGGNSIRVRGYSWSGSNAAEIVNGDASIQFTDLYQTHGKLSHSATGLIIGGNVGGFTIDQTDILLNGANVVVDQSQTAVHNNQLFFGSGVAIDATNPTAYPSASQIGVEFKDAGGTNSVATFTGTWIGSATNQCFVVDSGAQWVVAMTGGNVVNCHPPTSTNGALENRSTTSAINLTGVMFWQNGGSGPDVYNVSGAAAIALGSARFFTNSHGNIAGSWSGSYNLDNGTVINTVVSANGNVTVGPASGRTLIEGVGPGTTACGEWHQGSNVIPGKMDGTTAGCSLNLGTSNFPFATAAISGQVSMGNAALTALTVATLPACGSVVPSGTIAYVTDASAPAYNATLAGGGSTKTLALCNGAIWTAH